MLKIIALKYIMKYILYGGIKMNRNTNLKFANAAAQPSNSKWFEMIKRRDEIYSKGNDIRTEFERDYTRILHSLAYRRLKHKTQVFFNTNNDHICTRIEHVNHVESVSYTIARYLGLNVELTRAISTAHDLGHAPFGHEGEKIIKEISKKYLNEEFWHEKNGLHFVDEVELLEDNNRVKNNMNLTYAVRDGIISHCGEVDENSIFPREEAMDLMLFDSPGKYQPYTWEGCVVKISDKISYIGRDIEDAIRLKFIGDKELDVLYKIAAKYNHETINTTRLMHELIIDLCENSSSEKGLRLSKSSLNMMDEIKEFNYNYIYNSERFENFKKFSALVLNSIFEELLKLYKSGDTINNIISAKTNSDILNNEFFNWITQYCDLSDIKSNELNENSINHNNKKIYEKLENKDKYIRAIFDFISGMTDQYAINIFNELIQF